MEEFFDNFKTILLATKKEHNFINTRTCLCGYNAENPDDWNDHVADAQARKLIEFLWEK